MKELNFYDIFQRRRAMAQKMEESDVFLTVPDKQPEQFKFEEVEESFQRLHEEGHSVKVERLVSQDNGGFFGNIIFISTEPKTEEE